MTFNEEIGVALGVMGMSLESFLQLTPYQFQEAYKRFIEKTKSDRDAHENVAWQVARWQVLRTLCPPKKKKINVFDLIDLPGDDLIRKKKTGKGKPEKDETRFRALAEKWKRNG